MTPSKNRLICFCRSDFINNRKRKLSFNANNHIIMSWWLYTTPSLFGVEWKLFILCQIFHLFLEYLTYDELIIISWSEVGQFTSSFIELFKWLNRIYFPNCHKLLSWASGETRICFNVEFDPIQHFSVYFWGEIIFMRWNNTSLSTHWNAHYSIERFWLSSAESNIFNGFFPQESSSVKWVELFWDMQSTNAYLILYLLLRLSTYIYRPTI